MYGLAEFTADQLKKSTKSLANKSNQGTDSGSQQVQKYADIPTALQYRVAKGLNLPLPTYGVVSYSFFTMVPRGKHVIRVCLGTACYVRGGQRILEELVHQLGIEPGECTDDRNFSLETVRCLGACGLAPVVVIDEDTHGQMKPAKLPGILAQYQ